MQAKPIGAPRRSAWRAALDLLRGRAGRAHAHTVDADDVRSALTLQLEKTLGAVDFLAHVDHQLHFRYVSDASLRFIGYRREYLQTVTLHELVPSGETAVLDALLARAAQSGRVERATLHLMKSLTYPIAVELRVVASAHAGTPGFAVSAFDVSAWRANEERLTYELHSDRMTG
ncbi:PAS domain-containing protein, partial [Trinickia sp.]|uniref:PAS domain-containing protein n=1 Tax=Trinickia sp. TaxID=2571163 RepID=UPI003F7FCEFE